MKRHLVDTLYSGMVSALVGAIVLCCFEGSKGGRHIFRPDHRCAAEHGTEK